MKKSSSRPYFKNKQLILGNRQRGLFFPVAAAFAPLAANLIGKIIGRGKWKRTAKKRIKINQTSLMKHNKMTKRDKIMIMKREGPKRVTLSNGRTFIARYQRATRAHLPANVRLARPYKERAAPKGRQQRRWQVVQQVRGIGSQLSKLVRQVAKAPITLKNGKMALNELPNLYEKGTSKIKNKKI